MSDLIATVERVSANNLYHLQYLMQEVYGKKVALTYLQKKYDTTHLGKSYYGFFALNEVGIPMSFYGSVIYKLKNGKNTEYVAHAADILTLKHYSGKGLFSYLGKMVEDLLKKDGIDFIFGLPNQDSKHYVNKKWDYFDEMIGFKIPVACFPFEKVLRNMGLDNLYQKYVKLILKKYAVFKREMQNSLIKDEYLGIERDKDFFSYKTFTPNYIITINGSKVWIKTTGALHIGDMDFLDEQQLVGVIKTLKKIAFLLGLNEIVIQFQKNTPQSILLSKHFHAFPSWLIGFKSFHNKVPLNKVRIAYGDIDTF